MFVSFICLYFSHSFSRICIKHADFLSWFFRECLFLEILIPCFGSNAYISSVHLYTSKTSNILRRLSIFVQAVTVSEASKSRPKGSFRKPILNEPSLLTKKTVKTLPTKMKNLNYPSIHWTDLYWIGPTLNPYMPD